MPDIRVPESNTKNQSNQILWAQAFLWSLLTISIALFLAFCIDFYCEKYYSKGTKNVGQIASVTFSAIRLFETSIILLSALIVEQFFRGVGKSGVVSRILLGVQIVVLFVILILSSSHTSYDEYSHYEYEEQLQRGLVLKKIFDNASIMRSDTSNDLKAQAISEFKRKMASDSLDAYWRDVASISKSDGVKMKCSCLSAAIIMLVFVFVVSVYARGQILKLEQGYKNAKDQTS